VSLLYSTCSLCGCLAESCLPCTNPSYCSSCASCCCNIFHREWRKTNVIRGIRLEYINSAWLSVEVLGSVFSGLVAGSFALLAVGADSLVELLSGFAVLLYLRNEVGTPRKYSRKAANITSILLFTLIPVIGLGAVYSYSSGIKPEGSTLGMIIAATAVLIMPYLYLRKKKIGEDTRTLPLTMDAIASITCFLMSVTLLAGLFAEMFLGLWWVDYLATAIILIFVTKEALESYNKLGQATNP